ncbi:MAG: hypothetical protein ACOZQL_05405 [Myxococcota bacterium]
MTCKLRRWTGKLERNPSFDRFVNAISELSSADEEHGSVSLEHENGWNIGYTINRNLYLEKVDSDDPADRYHQTNASPEYVQRLWAELAAGNIQEILKEPWLPGYP